MKIYIVKNVHKDILDKPKHIDEIWVIGHAETNDVCVAFSILMQTVATYMMSYDHDVFKRSHEEHSNDNNVCMMFHSLDKFHNSLRMTTMIEYLVESLLELARQDGHITVVKDLKYVHGL